MSSFPLGCVVSVSIVYIVAGTFWRVVGNIFRDWFARWVSYCKLPWLSSELGEVRFMVTLPYVSLVVG